MQEPIYYCFEFATSGLTSEILNVFLQGNATQKAPKETLSLDKRKKFPAPRLLGG